MFTQPPHNRCFKRPEGYVRPRRSPTPPTVYVEPLSPSVSKLRALEPSFNYPPTNNNNTVLGYGLQSQQQPRQQHGFTPTPTRPRAQSDYHPGHGRSPSNIDTLAEAALAMSPSLVAPAEGRHGHNYAHAACKSIVEPPHKRARSAYFAPPQAGQYSSRPATSYEGNAWPNGSTTGRASSCSRPSNEEAALLINFRTGGGPASVAKKMPSPYPQPSVRPHANSFPTDIHYQRPIEQVSRAAYPHSFVRAPLLPPFHPQMRPSQLPPPNVPSPQKTSEGAGLSPKTSSERRESDDFAVTDGPIKFHHINGYAPTQEPHQMHTPREEALSTNDVANGEPLDVRKKRGWPKGKPRTGAKKSTSEKAQSKRATKASIKAAKARDVFAEAALESQKDTRRRHSSSQTPAPEGLERASPSIRSQSVPREIPMIVREVTPSRAARKQAKAVPETVCASCNSAREAVQQGGELDQWISCNGCKNWFHVDCAGFKKAIEVRDVDKYFCASCEPSHGKTTYVRKSARAHTSVDYAELQRGVLKTSEDSNEHHYIQPIKDGTFTFDPEMFPRMRPELVTREFFERSGTFIEPICIPAAWNPRPWDLRKQAEAAGAVNGDRGASDDTSVEHLENLEMVDANDLEYDTVPDDGQDKLDMVMPEGLTVRQVSNMVGPDYPLDVIDVKTQNSGGKWTLGRWADYYEEESDDKHVRNVISLEVSQTTLGRLLRRPKVVRDIDLQDEVWPQEEIDKGKFPRVQFYCLMSVADSYTDFHIDFGGSSVYYHILKGKKTFFFIPPKPKHLKAYEEWNDSPQQNFTFLPHTTKECYRVDLHAGDTMLIPSGWIHAVWTPETSLVIGGNFLTRMSLRNQFKIVDIEKNNGTPQKFRYPHFQRIMWYTAIKYLKDDPLPQAVSQDFYEGKPFDRNVPIWADFDGELAQLDERQGAQNARYYSQAEIDGLPDLVDFIFRTVMLVQGRIEGISADRMKRVNASIPKGYGEPLEVAKTFALWVAWKRGNEQPPAWAHPDAILPNSKAEGEPKKLSARALKDMQRKEAMAAWKVAPDRQSKRVLEKVEKAAASKDSTAQPAFPPAPRNAEEYATSILDDANFKGGSTTPAKSSSPSRTAANPHQPHQSPGQTSPQRFAPSSEMMMSAFPGQFLSTPKTSVLGPKRVACDACRKRRIRCKHKDLVTQAPTPPPPFNHQFTPGSANDGYFIPQSSEVGDNINVSPLQSRETQGQIYHYDLAEQQTNGDVQSQTPNEVASNGTAPMDGPFDSPMPGTNAYVNANIPMAMNGVPMFGDTAKRGRSKACFECRKSKRRCIHDESGNVDPVKAAETPIPRGSVASKKRSADDGSPIDVNKRLKPAEPGLSPAPMPMQGMHGILKPPGQQVSSRSSGTPPKAPPEVYHKLPGQFYRPSSANGNHEQQNEQSQHQHQTEGHHQPQQPAQQRNVQANGSAPPIDPSLFSMYPEPSSNGGPYSLPGNPYPAPDHSSANQASLYALPSLEQIATEVLDMNGGGDENGDAGLAAIQAFNRQNFIQAYQQQNGGLLPVSVAPPVDGSVDSGVSISGVTEQKDGSSPPGGVFNVFSVGNGSESVSHDSSLGNGQSPAMHHELPPAPEANFQQEQNQQIPYEAHPEAHDTAESPAFTEFHQTENDDNKGSPAEIPFYQPPTSMSPETARAMPHGFPPSSPMKQKRESFVATSPEMFRRNSREFSQALEES